MSETMSDTIREASSGQLLTAREAADYLKVGMTKFNELRRQHEFPVIRFMDDARYRISDLDAFIDRHTSWGWSTIGGQS